MKTIVLGDQETVSLFATSGVEGVVVKTAEEIADEVKKIRKSKEYALIIVTQSIVEMGGEVLFQLRVSKDLPIVMDIPGPEGPLTGVKTIYDYIREAVGIRV